MNENKAEASNVWYDIAAKQLADDIEDFLTDYADDPNIALVTVHARQFMQTIRQAPTKPNALLNL